MIEKKSINDIYERIAKAIDITEELFYLAKDNYTKLGEWIDEETPDYKIEIYPQGSFALGTVVRPITDEDDYDLDLVCEFDNSHYFDARELKKDIVEPLIDRYDEIESKKEKKRCWQVRYKASVNFHMDIVPSRNMISYIKITDKNEKNNTYKYKNSNPKGYIEWFKQRKQERFNTLKQEFFEKKVEFKAEVQQVDDYKIKTSLQKAIQILKRHRDIMFIDNSKKQTYFYNYYDNRC